MGFKKLAQKWRPLMTDMNAKPYNFVKHQMERGADDSSFLSRLIQAGESSPEVVSVNQWSASALFGGAGDTASSSSPLELIMPNLILMFSRSLDPCKHSS